jgi:N-acetylmuramoyl-L-alanine amidase
MKAFAGFLFLAVLLVVRGVCAATVEGVRFGAPAGSGARIVVDLSDKADFRAFSLVNPSRLVIDVEKSKHAVSEKDLTGLPSYAVRARLGGGTAARIVLELNRRFSIAKSFLLKPQSGFKWRLVVDIELSSSDKAPAAVGSEWYDNSISKKSEPAVERREQPAAAKTDAEKPLIVLDPGHGGKDPGAIGVSGVYEKHLTLAMAKQMRALLEKTGKYRVKLTRETDIFIALYARRRYARSVGANLFISIHADSIRKPETRGLSVYTLSEKASDKEAEKLAESENKVDLIAGIDLSGETQEVTDILIDLARRETNNHSSYFAEKLMTEIRKEITVLPNSHRFAGFAVLKSPDVPSVLIEMGYLSNKEEEKLLRQAPYREKLAKATVRAVNTYFSEKHKANFN